MATSAFKSTTKRSSSTTPLISRSEPDYIKNVPRGKFVNTERGSAAEISLDDLAVEFFSSSPLIGRDTVSRGRSVSRTRGDVSSSRRRRSLSTSRSHHIVTDDTQSEVDRSSKDDNRTRQMSILPIAKTSSYRQLGRSRSNQDLADYLDGYSVSRPEVVYDGVAVATMYELVNGTKILSGKLIGWKEILPPFNSQASALSNAESKDTCITQNGIEKIIPMVYTRNKADDTTEELESGGMYEATKKELGCAFQDIQTVLNQDKANHDPFAAMRLEEQKCGMARELPSSKASYAAARPSRDRRKKITDRSRVSKNLIEEADKIIEDFVSSVEDTDISSFDGERSDCSSSFGGMIKSRNAVIREAEFYKSSMGSDTRIAEMDGVILPWLEWETSADGSLSRRNNVTPNALKWDVEKETLMLHDPSSYSISSYGSWSPGPSLSLTGKREATSKSTLVSNNSSTFDMEEYLRLENVENILFQIYRNQNRISCGGLLLCRSGFV